MTTVDGNVYGLNCLGGPSRSVTSGSIGRTVANGETEAPKLAHDLRLAIGRLARRMRHLYAEGSKIS